MRKAHPIRDLFLTTRFFTLWGMVALVFVSSYFFNELFAFAKAILVFALALSLIDYLLMFVTKGKIVIERKSGDMLSNGDENAIKLFLENSYSIPLNLKIIDELPIQFQKRDFHLERFMKPNTQAETSYSLRPTERGVYEFGELHAYATSWLNLIEKRYTSEATHQVKVYPSYVQLKKYAIHSIADLNSQVGNQMLHRKGFSSEFDHIKEYNRGDDSRLINWKASARKNELMINSFMDEKSQQIYCIIDKGRLMRMPFDNMTLLDYAINATLMFSYVGIQKNDRIGIVTFGKKVDDILQPAKSKKQFNYILETLYKQETDFLESNYEELYVTMNRKAGHRSLLLLFTNFETYSSFERQLPYLRAMNQKHLLCVILFENTEITSIHEKRDDSIEDIYVKTIADKFIHEKKMIVKELKKLGILVVLSEPKNLTINVVNQYLNLKTRNFI